LKNKPYFVVTAENSSMSKRFVLAAVFGLLFESTAIAQNKDPLVCNVADFKMLALATNDEQAREKSVSDWLTKFGKVCAADQIVFIRGNLAPWLGTANTLKVNQSIETLLSEKKNAQKNYDADVSELEKNKNNAPVNKPQTETLSTRR
jgi:uncharacterized FAD-dependent dehydrogenase